MKARILSGVVGLGIIVPPLVWGGQRGAEIVVLIAMLIGLEEYAGLVLGEARRKAFALLLAFAAPVWALLVWGPAEWHVPGIAAAALALFLVPMFSWADTTAGAHAGLRLVAGLVYVPVLMSFLPRLRALDGGLTWLFLALAITWAGDTGAYFSGRAFGKTPLFPRVSPKKTWEGAIGGALLAAAFSAGLCLAFLPRVSLVHALVFGVLVDVFGILGDLVESMLKRAFGIKDSGWIMPGHGGILDRIDSLLFTAPVLWIYATLFQLG